MIAPELSTDNSRVKLVEPEVERDASLGVKWLEGDAGRQTLALMGVLDSDNKESSLEAERLRIKDFIEKDDQLNWMINFDNKIVGTIWVDLEPTQHLLAPAVHIMIGDPIARGHGVGKSAIGSVIKYLQNLGYKKIYSRNLVKNEVASKLLSSTGFKSLGDKYSDSDGLEWQNSVLELEV